MAPVVMDMNGELIWNGPEQHAFNFGVYRYREEQVLAWWNGTLFPEPVGRGNGVIKLYNAHYEQIHEVTLAGNFLELEPGVRYPSNIDVHELLITPENTIVVTANNVTQADLTSVGGPVDGWVVNAMVYEVGIATNDVLFEWSALDHLDDVPFTASVYPLGVEGFDGSSQSKAWGWFHINSAEPFEGGYILSSRFLCSAIAIDGSDGHVKWRLGGREELGRDFELVGSDAHTNFCYQHDIRIAEKWKSGLTLRMHDNHNSPIENNTVPSTAKWIDLDFDTGKVSLSQRFLNHSGPVFATAQGNVQQLADGNIFVGHGWIPVMEEFSSAGEISTTIQFGAADPRPGGGYLSAEEPTLGYRDFKHHWTGCPTTKPDVVAESSGDGLKVFVSWNGATDVVAWNFYGGQTESHLECLATVNRAGFETATKVPGVAYVQVKPVLKKDSTCTVVSSAIVKVM